jgi:hypothetical protein
VKILGPAAGGAVLGRVVGGKSGAAKGAVIGGAAGTGWVLSTRGKEVRVGKGADLSVKLTAPVTVRVLRKSSEGLRPSDSLHALRCRSIARLV